jgi:hypothetical protein
MDVTGNWVLSPFIEKRCGDSWCHKADLKQHPARRWTAKGKPRQLAMAFVPWPWVVSPTQHSSFRHERAVDKA